jgi:hypothetical protein
MNQRCLPVNGVGPGLVSGAAQEWRRAAANNPQVRKYL